MAATFADGVTIKVNGVAVEISAAEQQADHAVVHYTIPAVADGDTVTWEYAKASGSIVAESGGTALEDVTAQSVTNNVSDLIGDALRTDTHLSVQYSSGQWIDPAGSNVWTNFNAATLTTSNYGDMVTLNGTDQYISTPADIPSLSPGNTDFTLIAWVIIDAFQSNPNLAAVIAMKDNANADDEIEFDIMAEQSGHLYRFLLNDQNAYSEVDSVTYGSAQLNTPTLLFAWYDHADLSLNIQVNNGAIDTYICPRANGVTSPTNTFDIGSDSAGGTSPVNFFNGKIAFYYLGRKLTQTEKDYLWNSGAGRALFA